MFKVLCKIFLCWLFSFSIAAEWSTEPPVSVELQLLDVHLGTPYAKTKKRLTELYGVPEFRTIPHVFDVFWVDKKAETSLMIAPHEEDASRIGTIQIDGTQPIGGLNFFADLNLGDSEKSILLKFPRAIMDAKMKPGYHHYDIPDSNYSIETEDGKVVSIRIWEDYVTLIREGDNSIALTENLALSATQKGLLKKPIDFDKLTEFVADPLRSYCNSRYPLRLDPQGTAYIDINLIKDENLTFIPSTFFLDTGWSKTTISTDLCQKIHCKLLPITSLKQKPLPQETVVSGSAISMGTTLVTMNSLDMNSQAREILNIKRIDGVLGGDVLFSHPLFINFKHGYICFPSLSIPDIAHAIQLKKFALRHNHLVIWSDLYANGQMIKNVLLDSGAEITSLLRENIVRLKLNKLDTVVSTIRTSGTIDQNPTYGPVEIGWPTYGITQKLDIITQEPDTETNKMSFIGIDFLRHYIMSLDIKSDVFYLGE